MAAKMTNKFWIPVGALMAVAIWAVPPTASKAQQKQNLAPRSAEARHYAACMALARRDPKAAHESALEGATRPRPRSVVGAQAAVSSTQPPPVSP